MASQQAVGRLVPGRRAIPSMGTLTRCSGTSSVVTILSKVTQQFGNEFSAHEKCLSFSVLFKLNRIFKELWNEMI